MYASPPPAVQYGIPYSKSRTIPLYAPQNRRAKLSALHARLALPPALPLNLLSRTLIDASAKPNPDHNNASLAILGADLLGYYTAEHLMCHYPRLPMPVLFAAQYAYVGAATLASLREGWGVEVAAAPGDEVEQGILQLKRIVAGNSVVEDENGRTQRLEELRAQAAGQRIGGTGRRNEDQNYRRGWSSRIVYDDQFGDLNTNLPQPTSEAPAAGAISSTAGDAISPSPATTETDPVTVTQASTAFVRALVGSLYLSAGLPAVRNFHTAHILSRHLALHTLFHFTHPTRDLSRLCAREGWEPPVARLISETGRLSRTPVFVVGVYSGGDKLGEGAGASLNEARVRAAAAALRSWYLYSPVKGEVTLPSDAAEGKRWRENVVDIGEIVT